MDYEEYFRLFYLIKIIRINQGLSVFDVKVIMNMIKKMKLKNVMKHIDIIGEDQMNDHNKIDFMLNLN